MSVDGARELPDDLGALIDPSSFAGQQVVEPYRLLTVQELAQLQPPKYLIAGILPEGVGATTGAAGVGKTFVVLDQALSIATGTRWFGREVRQGPVVYIAAEGVSGISSRVQAWLDEHDLDDAPMFHLLPEAVNLLDQGALQRVLATIAAMPVAPVLVVVDTVARTMVGGDENSARDMGLYIDAVGKLKPLGGHQHLIHHEGWSGDHERGSTALRGAVDVMNSVKADGAGIRLTCVKMKDAEPFDDWRMHLATHLDSCVVRLGTPVGQLAPAELRLLTESHEAFGTRETSAKALREACSLPKSSFYRALKTLADRGFLSERDAASGATYQVSDEGVAHLSPNQSQTVPRDTPDQSHRPRSFRDGGTPDPDGAYDPAVDMTLPLNERLCLIEVAESFQGAEWEVAA